MSSDANKVSGPDLEKEGVAAGSIADGAVLLGHVMSEAVLVVRQGERFHAVGATCSHYGGPLAEGLVEGDTIRCPWHHACFDLRSGEAVGAPALAPIACYEVTRSGDRLFVIGRKTAPAARTTSEPASVVVVGGGAAGFAAAEMLRRRGFAGSLTMLSADSSAPYDRPNASKDYLSGGAPEEWMPLRGDDWYVERKIDVRLGARVTAIDVAGKRVRTGGGDVAYDALVLATGAEPIRLPVPGADLPHVHVLRSLADSRAIIEQARSGRRAVVVGASFIGLEAAASLRKRGLEVHVVAPETRPLARVLGEAIGGVIQKAHEAEGVVFHLGRKPAAIDPGAVVLDDGTRFDADVVVMGVGVRPNLALAEAAGLKVDRGVVVDANLRTSAPDVWAAGDIARWEHRRFGSVRIEHWVVAERQGQTVANNVLASRGSGSLAPFEAVPFFWSNHFDVGLNYVGHAEAWDSIDVDGDLEARDFTAAFRKQGRTLAVATMGRDGASLEAELAMERDDEAALQRLAAKK
jgi:NADPH-dependent 2,4-dienoyl-CoA reductase/sulfur reductase-like enzyme/nitrite reductase/ring-hydroxylating ferredoxin subunit